MSKESNVVEFYVLCNKLKDIVRTGWKDWGVKRERVESVAEHIFGVQMLAIAMHSEFEYNVDIQKVLTMLAVHETEEIIIGDLTLFQISKEEKEKMGHDAVCKIFSKLSNAKYIEELIFEFDERKSPEAKFAFYCDKLECDIQSKLYDNEHCVDLNNQQNNKTFYAPAVQSLFKKGCTFSQMWLEFGQKRYDYDQNFTNVSNYVKNNEIKIN